MKPSSFDSLTTFEFTDDIKIPLPELGQPFSSPPKSSQRLIPPTTYQFQRDGWGDNARIWALYPSSSFGDPQRKSSSLITDASPTFNPIVAMMRSPSLSSKDPLGGGGFHEFHVIDPAVTPPTHCVRKVTGRTYALYEGPGDPDEYSHSRKIMDLQTECERTVST